MTGRAPGEHAGPQPMGGDEIAHRASVQAAHAPTAATRAASGRLRVRECGTGNHGATADQALDWFIGWRFPALDPSPFADLTPVFEFLIHTVADLDDATVGAAAVIVTWHLCSPKRHH
jgi:hypothetical protein